MTLPEDQEVGGNFFALIFILFRKIYDIIFVLEMITVSSEDHDNDCGEHVLVEAANEEVVTSSNSDIIIVKRV